LDAILARVQANETFFEIFCQNASNPLCLVQSTCFGWFRIIWLPHVDRCKIRSWDAVWARVWTDETIVEFFIQKTSNPLVKVQNSHFGWFCTICWNKCTIAKSGPGMPFGLEFGSMKLFLSYPAKTHPIHYFRSKT